MAGNFDCVDGNMDVLMNDNTTKKIRDLKKGDCVYAINYDGESFKYIKTAVLEVNKRRSSCIKVTLNDGRSLICSPNHQWLTQAGWLYTFDDSTINDNVVYLKDGMIMFGFTRNFSGVPRESRLYMAGYITSIEIYSRNLVPLHSGEYADYVFRKDLITERIYNYLQYFGIDVHLSECFAHDKDTNEYFTTRKLSVTYRDMLKFSEKQSRYTDDPEFTRGFVAGVYDADGTINPFSKYIKSSKKEYLTILESGVKSRDFEYSYDSEEMIASLIGGPTELIRFYNVYNPVTVTSVDNLKIRNRRVNNTRVVKIEEIKSNDMYEVITSARSFIANGIVSHNSSKVF